MGTQEMTRFGMVERDFEELAGLLADVVLRERRAGEEVTRFRQRFLEMRYCLAPVEALPAAAKVLASVFPRSDEALRFASALTDAAAAGLQP